MKSASGLIQASLHFLLAAGLLAAACGPSAIPASPASGPVDTSAKPKFNALLERARASNGVIRGAFSDRDPELIRAEEEAFKKQFGIDLRLENEPGHVSRDIPPKILQAQKAGKGVVDVVGGGVSNMRPLLEAGALGEPPWDALDEQWPQVAEFRKLFPDPMADGRKLSDFCMLQSTNVWGLVYNTNKVKPSDVAGLKWDDLLTEKWRGRVAVDAQAAGTKAMSFAKGWPLERVAAWANNLGANQAKIIQGGYVAVAPVVVQGEADIAELTLPEAIRQRELGAPLDFAWPEFVFSTRTVTCLPKVLAGDPALAALHWAWNNFEGSYLADEMGLGTSSTASRPLYGPEAGKYRLGKVLKDAGYTLDQPDRLAGPKTADDEALIPKIRKTVEESYKAGVQSGKRVPYPWGCAANHPSCVR